MKTRFLNCCLIPFLMVMAVPTIADEEQDLISVLQSSTGVVQKCNACQRLRIIGTVKAVPALAALLGEERTSHAARHVLESMPCPEAGTVLRNALNSTSGLVKAGIINSIGIRHDRDSVPQLTELLADSDINVAVSAIAALGKIASPQAITALNTLKIDSSPVLQTPLNEALLMCAGELVASGDKQAGYMIYGKIYETEVPQHFRVAAYRGLISASDGKSAIKLVENGLKGRELSAITASLQMAGEIKGEATSKKLSKLLPKLAPEIQSRLIDALIRHDGSSVQAAILSVANSPDQDVRVAALKGLGRVGNESAVPLLLASLASQINTEQEAAREGLIRLPGKSITQAITESIPGIAGPAKLEAIRILGLRNDAVAVPFLLQMIENTDESVGTASIQVLSMLVDESSVKDLLELLFKAKTDSRRKEIEKALVSACVRSPKKEKGTEQITAAIKDADTANHCALLRIFSRLTDSGALSALREGITNCEKEIQDTAVRGIAAFPDPAAITDQLAYARSTSNLTHRILLLRGCMKLVDETTSIPADKKIEVCKDIMGIADRTEEKMLVISCLGKINTIGALATLETFLSDPAMKTAAATAMLKIGKSPDISRMDMCGPLLQKANDVLNISQKK